MWTLSSISVSAPTFTATSISTPDGSGQAVHPDVIYVPEGFLGYEYWMACTPYPFGNDRVENPIIRVSHDGVNWHVVPGAPDPLIGTPSEPEWHHADTDIVLHQDTLYMFFITTSRDTAETQFSMISTSDGMHWTSPEVVYHDVWGVSPSVTVERENQWSLWYVWCDTKSRTPCSRLYRRTGCSPLSLGPAHSCVLDIPGHIVWHLDVIAVRVGYEAIVAAFPVDTDPSRSRLFHATSDDGARFALSCTKPVLKPSMLGWDNRMIYRSTFVKYGNEYLLWYSAASWGMRCGIAFARGQLSELHVRRTSAVDSVRLRRLIAEDIVGLLKYFAARLMPEKWYALLFRVRDYIQSAFARPR